MKFNTSSLQRNIESLTDQIDGLCNERPDTIFGEIQSTLECVRDALEEIVNVLDDASDAE